MATRQVNPNVNTMARAVHVDAIERLHQAGANHVLSESILGFQLLQIAMVEMGVLPKLSDYVIREVVWNGKPITIHELTKKYSGKFKIICVVEDKTAIEPSLDYSLREGIHLVVLGSPANIDHLFKKRG